MRIPAAPNRVSRVDAGLQWRRRARLAFCPQQLRQTMPTGTILVADDDAAIRTVLNQALARAGYEVRSTGTASGLWRWVAAGEGDLVVTDVVMRYETALAVLPRIKKLRPDLPIIVMS